MSYEDIYNYTDETITLDKIRHPYLTLDELKNITRKKAIRLFRKGKHVESISRTQVVMSIIMAASRIKWSITDPRGIREFWYNPVKPIFYRIYGSEIDDMDESSITRICDVLSHILSVMVQSRIISYKDLGIEDFRTQRMLWESIDNANCWSNVVLFVEKDAAYIHLRPLKNLLNITLISGGGVSKTALNEYMMSRLPKGKYKLFTLTDYDPWGFFISGECFKKLGRMGWELDVTRIGLNIDQVDKEILGRQKYPVKMDKKGQVWAPKYGLLGRLRTVYRTRKATIVDEETGKKKKIDERYLAYEGRKGWGLEIEAISGQEGGAQKLREIVLTELLKPRKKEEGQYLNEESRLSEIRSPIWYNINDDYECLPVNKYDIKYYKEMREPEKITTYITRNTYTKIQRHREAKKDSDLKDPTDQLDEVTRDISRIEENYDDEAGITTDEYNSLISLITYHLREQIKQLEESIDRLEKPLLMELGEKQTEIEIQRRDELEPYEQERSQLEDTIRDIETSYEKDNSELFKIHRESGYLRTESSWKWYDDNWVYSYEDRSPDVEELSFGLTAGAHEADLREHKKDTSVEHLFKIVSDFDVSAAQMYILEDIRMDKDIQQAIHDILEKLIDNKKDRELEKRWHDKWDEYLEEEQ